MLSRERSMRFSGSFEWLRVMPIPPQPEPEPKPLPLPAPVPEPSPDPGPTNPIPPPEPMTKDADFFIARSSFTLTREPIEPATRSQPRPREASW